MEARFERQDIALVADTLRGNHTVLDVGGGTGALVREIAGRVDAITTVEPHASREADDGVATVGQLEAFLRAWGMDADEARTAAGRLDQDGNGHITRDEYLTAWTSFLLSDDSEDKGSTLLGPLT
ncbi:hypothetical protein [Streptomyces sp. NPDC089799]|uniref:hypothetical protein n=1 Tax=Streptomyces sp. NPDC089799 TaxID=3155066 RepID=UPI003447E7F4